MGRCYSVPVPIRQTLRTDKLPAVWLITDARNDAVLAHALARLPRGSGMIFRHYHLTEPDRRARFGPVARLARRHGHTVILSGTARQAQAWGADGAYGAPPQLARGPAPLRLLTVHSLREIGQANRMRAAAVLLSPVFPTRSHPGGKVLGPARFRLLAARSRVPVIALGGMSAARAHRYGLRKWAAIDAFA